MIRPEVWILVALFSGVAGWMDWRTRRIPNWLTVPGILGGILINSVLSGWQGAKMGLLGAALGLGVLLPFVLVRAFGGGDWKLVGALGALLGARALVAVMAVTILVNGIMAVIVIIAKKRVGQTLRNLGMLLTSLVTFHLPGRELSVDSPESLKMPFGVAVAITVVAFAVAQLWRPW
jgi:prepilin peptidase CpaA